MSNGFIIGYKKGNLIDATEKIIVHGCNAQGKMNSGVAKAIREKWPGAFGVYAKVHQQFGLELGSVLWYESPEEKLIGNAITQEFYGSDGKKYVNYDATAAALQSINDVAIELGCDIAMPKIGAGLGGGNWTIIENIIETTCTRPVTVYYI